MWLQWWAEDKESLVEMCAIFGLFFVCNFSRQICTKGWLWVGGGGGEGDPSGVRTNPPNQVILPPSSFFLKSPRICFRGLHLTEVMRTFFTDESKKLSATPILRGGGPARTENNDFQQKHRRVVLR